MRVIFATIFALLPLVLFGTAQAAARQRFTVQTPSGPILVESFASRASGSRPAVLILSGSRGFGASVYDEIGQTFDASGLDAYLVHVLSPADLNSIINAGSARARIDFYAKRLPDWTSAVQSVVSYISAQPRRAGKVGVLGISLGAQIAAAASVNRQDVSALVLIDGGFPNGYSQPVRSLPPLHLIWGGADRTFPVAIARELRQMAQALGGAAHLDIYEGGAHDFFLKPETRQARAAHNSAAAFLASQLTR